MLKDNTRAMTTNCHNHPFVIKHFSPFPHFSVSRFLDLIRDRPWLMGGLIAIFVAFAAYTAKSLIQEKQILTNCTIPAGAQPCNGSLKCRSITQGGSNFCVYRKNFPDHQKCETPCP